jgi:phosphomannomutase
VIDCGNGSMSMTAPDIFKKLGFKVKELYCKPDPNFSNRGSEPTFKNTKDLRKKVKKEKADFGVAFDGDGDRAIIIDDKGKYLKGDQVGIIIAKYILKSSKNKKIIATIPCSMALEKELRSADIIRVPVGHTFIILNCKKKKAILGMEESGHFCLPQYFLFDDAILIPLKVAELILKESKKLSKFVKTIKIYPFKELKFDCPDQNKFKLIDNLIQKFLKDHKRVSHIDGVRIDFNYGWILIRPSNTSPSVRLYIEAKDKLKLKKLEEKFSKILKKEIKKI